MNSRRLRSRPPARLHGFTLIEMMVVITIVLVLASLTVAIFATTMDSDRIRSGARLTQSALMGGLARAAKARQPRGIRLILDENDPTTVRSMIYIGPPDVGTNGGWRQGIVQIGRFDIMGGAPPVPDVSNLNGEATIDEIRVVRGYDTGWIELAQRGLLVDGSRIQIPANTGPWYTVRARQLIDTIPSDLFWRNGGAEVLILTLPINNPMPPIPFGTPRSLGPDGQPGFAGVDDDGNGTIDDTGADEYRELGWPGSDDTTNIHAFPPEPADGVGNYILELAPTPLPDEDPLQLPSGVVIDLFNSLLPSSWYEEQTIAGPLLPTTDPLYIAGWRHDADASGSNIIIRRYGVNQSSPRQMDILFSPQGEVTGPLSAIGKIHLLLAETGDAEQRLAPEVSEGEKLIMTLFPQTGSVSSHPLFVNPVDPLDPSRRFEYAETGEVAGR